MEESSLSRAAALPWSAAPTKLEKEDLPLQAYPLQPQPARASLSGLLSKDLQLPFPQDHGWDQHSSGEGMPAAGRKDSVHANGLIESSFEGRLVQPYIKTVSKCAEHDTGRVCGTFKNFLQRQHFVSAVFLLSSSEREREREKIFGFFRPECRTEILGMY